MKLFIYRITIVTVILSSGAFSLFSQNISPHVPTCGFDHMNKLACEHEPKLEEEIKRYLSEVVPMLAAKK